MQDALAQTQVPNCGPIPCRKIAAGLLSTWSAGLFGVTSVSAIISAELTDERERLIASASSAVQLIKDITRYT
jgi:hypothetical protein